MGLLIDYFPAPSDAEAASTIDWPAGPNGGPPKRAFRRKQPGFLTVSGRGVEPMVSLGMFEELLTGKTFRQQLDDPSSRVILAERDGGERLVIRIADGFVAALADADPQHLAELAGPWSKIEEFGAGASVPGLTDFLHRLKGLAEFAVREHQSVYCWLSI